MTMPASLRQHLQQKNAPPEPAPEPAPDPETLDQIKTLIANPPPGFDVEQLAKAYGLDVPEADTRAAEEKAPKKRKPRSDKGKARTKKAAEPAPGAAGDMPATVLESFTPGLLHACAQGGLPAEEAAKYLELAKGAA